MKLPTPIPVSQLAEIIGATLVGNRDLLATGINEIHQVEAGDISFVDVEKYYKKALHSAADIILIDKEVICPDGKALLVCAEPFKAYNDLVLSYRPIIPQTKEISDTAIIHSSAIIEPNVKIGPYVEIGPDCHIQANVTIGEYTVIGKEVLIQSGSHIGADAFYFKKTAEGYRKWRSCGRVVIEDQVDIGVGNTVCRGVSADTVIGTGSKLDAQVHIGHDVRIGKHCLIAAQVGIAGNTSLGDRVILYGQVGIAQNLHIGDDAIILAKSGVSKDLEGGKTYFGAPAGEVRSMYRELAALRHLPEFLANYYR
ncbi:MAG: UDP-3-O-(3-hydroxymyristoyl)glucosamine N-acyltransferase [Saprospiraceae bacterium]|nr:UDP-3-O-(3-hydroxymyristoyl)glucosamine N-acyltransferase [Lewinella sp.]